MPYPSVLFVQDDPSTSPNVRAAFHAHGAREPLRIGHARTLGEAVASLGRGSAECVVVDLDLPDSSGMATYRALREAAPTIPIVLLVAPGDEALAAEALSLGADDCIPGDSGPEQIGRAVRHALLRARARPSVEQLEAVLECVPDAYLTVDAAGFVAYANDAAETLFDATRASLLGRPLAEALPALAGTRIHAELARGVAAARDFEEHLPALDLWVDARLFPTPAGTTASLRDATARRRDTTLHQRVLEAAPIGVSIAEVELNGCPVRYVNPAFERMTGHTRDEIIGGGWPLIRGAGTDPAATRRIADAVAAGEPVRLELMNYRSDGTPFWNDLAIAPLHDDAGHVTHFVAIQQDVTERRRAEDALRDEGRSVATLIHNLPGMAYRCANDAQWTMEFASEGALDLMGVPAAQLMDGTVHVGDLVHADDRARVWDEIQTALAENRPFDLTYRIVTPAGREKWVWEQGRAVPPRDGAPAALEGFVSNATRQKTLEEQLRQAQKMDALGRLAGGVAHDFNNLLTAIKGTASLMLLDLAPEDPLHADAE
ncbi:MAG TPA: PAS domain S-box protein, partial [Longimicrobium sp.]